MPDDVDIIKKVVVTVPDEAGNYTVAAVVDSFDRSPYPEYIEDNQNTGSLTLATPLEDALASNGYNPV